MSLAYREIPPQQCPRCKAILTVPLNQAACHNCGYTIAQSQTGNATPRLQFRSGPPTIAPLTKVSSNDTDPSAPFTSGMQRVPLRSNTEQNKMPQEPQRLQFTSGIQSVPMISGMQSVPLTPRTHNLFITPGIPSVPMIPSTQSISPNVVPPARNTVPSPQQLQPPPATASKKESEAIQKRVHPVLVYLLCIMLVIALFIFAGIHAAGLSLASLTSHHTSTIALKESYPKPSGPALFTDTFNDDSSGWNLQSAVGNYSVAIGNGVLTLENDKNTLLWELLPGERSLGNFELTMNAVLSKGDPNNGYGIYIRGTANQNSDLATYYRFELYGDGSYAIFKGSQNGTANTKIVDYILSPAIQKQGKVNHIMIVAKGPYMSFIVNNQLLQTFSDTSYTRGSIALFVANLPQAKPVAQAQFSQLSIYPV